MISPVPLRVGITERHGMFDEVARNPPRGVAYDFPSADTATTRLIRSSVKGYLRTFQHSSCDILEAVFSPIVTDAPWILSTDSFHSVLTFTLLGLPLPRSLRISYIDHLLKQSNFRRLVLWSDAAYRELEGVLGKSHCELLEKATVVHPAIRTVADQEKRPAQDGCIRLLFSGDFFRKGGANVIDAFEMLQRQYPHVRLRVCSDERFDFNTPDTELRNTYLTKIRSNEHITFGRVPRQEMVERVLPESDIYLLPTYAEAFGFALLEAMAFGLPVISTTEFAIPEIVEHDSTGYLIDTSGFCIRDFVQGYVVETIPDEFREKVSYDLYESLAQLIEQPDLRLQMGRRGQEVARTKFGFENRNRRMFEIYRECLA